ncbi:MAG: VWA domain-containing protein [Chloroflexi bacterium]|nr:VWA domain-containing protein [Chloroflexota bacterium]
MGCIFLLLLFAALVCAFFSLLFPRLAHAATPNPLPLFAILLIDNSNSMFEKGGVGSDPALLRIDAARLFLSYLGVDEPDLTHQAGVIFFGTEAETAVPLTPLTHQQQRSQLFDHIANPPRLGWTDHLAALELAAAQLEAVTTPHRPAIILLTDGKPEWEKTPTTAEMNVYTAALHAISQQLAAASTPLFVILLSNPAADADPDVAAVWQPLWEEMSAATPDGRFYLAQTAADLPNIYHDIVVTLTHRQTEGIVLDTAVAQTNEQSLTIPPGLAQLTLVISKESPTQTVAIHSGDGQLLDASQPQVRQAGGGVPAREEVWIIEQPVPGPWSVRITGAGHVTVWQDSIPAPTAVPTPNPSPTAPASPTTWPTTHTTIPTHQPTPTNQPLPTITKTAVLQTVPLAKPAETAGSSQRPGWPWLLAGLFLLGASTAVLYRRQQQNQPTVSGTLHLLDGRQFNSGQTTSDLDSLNCLQVSLGQPPADIPLPGAQGRVVIRPGRPLADLWEMLISGHGRVQLDDTPLAHEKRLTDTAVIQFGPDSRIRYENLRLRQAEREDNERR